MVLAAVALSFSEAGPARVGVGAEVVLDEAVGHQGPGGRSSERGLLPGRGQVVTSDLLRLSLTLLTYSRLSSRRSECEDRDRYVTGMKLSDLADCLHVGRRWEMPAGPAARAPLARPAPRAARGGRVSSRLPHLSPTTAATQTVGVTVGTTTSTVAAGDDSRFTDARTPTGAAGRGLGGGYPNPTVTVVAAGVAGPRSAADATTTNSRTPTARAIPIKVETACTATGSRSSSTPSGLRVLSSASGSATTTAPVRLARSCSTRERSRPMQGRG
jgi:hypothetical protein